jgi:hypothetical protein
VRRVVSGSWSAAAAGEEEEVEDWGGEDGEDDEDWAVNEAEDGEGMFVVVEVG